MRMICFFVRVKDTDNIDAESEERAKRQKTERHTFALKRRRENE